MIDVLLKTLSSCKAISGWKVNHTLTESYELFYVQDRLETQRATDVEDISVTVYVDKDGKRGQSTFTAYSYMGEEDLNALLEQNIFAAGFALNPYFELPGPQEGNPAEASSNISNRSLADAAADVKEAVFSVTIPEGGSLSSTEIFVYRITDRVVNSRGVDVTSVSCRGMIETIPNWAAGSDEVETYKRIDFGSLDKADLAAQVQEALDVTHARSKAVNLSELSLAPDAGLPVILENGEVSRVFGYFTGDLNYTRKYTKSNLFELGDPMQGEAVSGDLVSIRLVPAYEGAVASRATDGDGVVLGEVELVKGGKALARWGSYQYGYYLGEKEPTGDVPVTVAAAGKTSFTQMQKAPCLRCVRFSGLQLDPFSGYLGGEVRLGFYFDGEKEIPVTGFSVSGNIHELKSRLTLSSETVTLARYHGPKYMLLPGMKVL